MHTAGLEPANPRGEEVYSLPILPLTHVCLNGLVGCEPDSRQIVKELHHSRGAGHLTG